MDFNGWAGGQKRSIFFFHTISPQLNLLSKTLSTPNSSESTYSFWTKIKIKKSSCY